MNQLQAFKQKGRLLRAHLSQTLQTEVTLSQAYEALAASEGTTWNELSARLVNAKPDVTINRLVAPGPLKVRAVFTTGDDSAAAEFDAEPWLIWAGPERIGKLLKQLRLSPVEGFERAYGGNNALALGIAHLCSGEETGPLPTSVLTQVYRHIAAKDELGHDYGGSYCYVDQADLLSWVKAQPYGQELVVNVLGAVIDDLLPVESHCEGVVDVDLGKPEHAATLLEVCQSAWEHARGHWAATRARRDNCEYLIERGDVLGAMAECCVMPSEGSDEEPEYTDDAVRKVEDKLHELGYELHARCLASGNISFDEPMMGMSTFGAQAVGAWFRNVHSCTLYRKESENTVRAYKAVGGAPFSKEYPMEDCEPARVVQW